MVFEHDYTNFPELTNRQIEEFGFTSPHVQITENFNAEVVRVHDGDTITVSTSFRDFIFPIRFLDIDAPEMNEGGEEARDYVRGRILNKIVTVLINRKNRVDKWGRLLGRIIHGGSDIGEEELRLGIVTTFKNRREEQLPKMDKMFNIKQWVS